MLPIISPLPCIWNNASVLWLAPTLQEAIKASGDEDGWGSEPLADEVLAKMEGFYDAQGNPQNGLEAYRERVANGASVELFGVAE